MTKITIHEGDDYCIIWKDDQQVFCYHGGITRCCQEVCSALGAAFDTIDANNDEFDWETVKGKTLSEFNTEVRKRRAARKRKEIKALQAQLNKQKNELAALGR